VSSKSYASWRLLMQLKQKNAKDAKTYFPLNKGIG